MRFFRSNYKKKRLKFNKLAQPLYIVVALALTACGTTQKDTTAQREHPTGKSTASIETQRSAPRGGLNAILEPEDNAGDEDNTSYSSGSTKSVWQPIRANFKLDEHMDNPAIAKELKWYRSNPSFLYRATERSSRYLHYVFSEIKQRNMPAEIALLPIVESAYDPFAYSKSGAAGLWQFVPATGSNFGLKRSWWYDGRKDVVASTDAALTYLQYLHDHFDGDWLLAIAAYNFGEGSIRRAVDENRRRGKPTDFWSLNLREETRTYVPRLLALAKIVKEPYAYGINLYSVPNQAYFAAADTNGQLDLAKAASMAQVDVEEVRRLNPGFHHWATDPNGPQRLLLPVDSVERFSQRLAALPKEERVTWSRYEVKKGDTLAGIARKYKIDTGTLVATNRLSSNTLKPGQSLLLPEGGPAPTAGQTAQAENTSQTPLGSRQVFHTVQAGENLRRIALRYNVTPQDLMRWNGMSEGDFVKLGQKMSVWTTAKVDNATQQASATTIVQDGSHKVGYTVRSGDSLHAIASKFNVQVEDIARWNQVNPRALLQPGQRLTLFVDSSVADTRR